MKGLTTLIGAAALLAAVAPVSAADLQSTKDTPVAVTNPFGMHSGTWTGFYVGINGGYGWDSALNFSDVYSSGKTSLGALETGTRPAGWFYGLSAGADWQFSGIVAGIETDIDMSNIGDDSAVKACMTVGPKCVPVAIGSTTAHSTIDWFGTLRARVGIPLASNFLPYATGGLAYGGVSNRSVTQYTNLAADETKFGWSAGVGAEYRISPGWSVKAEWLHIDLGSSTLSGALPFPGLGVSANSQHNEVDLAKFGLVYKIGSDYAHPTQ